MVFDLNKKGQLSMEFILILTVIILLLLTLSIPLRDSTEQTVSSFTKVTYADKAMHDVYDAIKVLSAANEGQITVNMYIPEDVNFYIKNGIISYDVRFDYNVSDLGVANCKDFICKKALNSGQVELNTNKYTDGRFKVVVQKKADGFFWS